MCQNFFFFFKISLHKFYVKFYDKFDVKNAPPKCKCFERSIEVDNRQNGADRNKMTSREIAARLNLIVIRCFVVVKEK